MDSTESGPLRVSMFPYIPDLADDKLDGLKRYIATKFKECTGLEVLVESNADPYNLDQLKTKYLSSDPDSAYDIMEIDAVLLGELVKADCIEKFDDHDIDMRQFFPWCVQSVTVENEVYGIPTLQCANFLIEVASGDHSAVCSPVLKDWQSSTISKLSTAIRHYRTIFGHRILVAGDFPGSWGIPMLYLEAYVDKLRGDSVYEGVDATVVDQKLIKNLKEFTDFGEKYEGMNRDTDCYHDDHKALIRRYVNSKHILMYCYSESLSEILLQASTHRKHLRVLNIASTPLDKCNYLVTYTDALVVNKSSFSDPLKRQQIEKFVEFYSSLDFRKKFAFGCDLPPRIRRVLLARYVLPAHQAFFTEYKATGKGYYKQFHDILVRHSIAAPNHDINERRIQLQRDLMVLLHGM